MKKIVLSIGLVFLFFSKIWAQGFTISGNQLLDANGNNFVIKGVNLPLSWFVNDVNNNIANIKKVTNSNCFRIVVNVSSADNAWQTCVQKCIDNKVIPMVELHDVTGNNSPTDLNKMAQFWASKASYFNKPEIARYILINIANEWGDWYMSSTATGTVSRATWRDAYKTAVKTIRDAGIKTTLVIDAAGYGQDNKTQTLLAYAKEVQASDPYHNCLFSIHMYCEWSVNGNSSVTSLLPAVKNAGIPVIVGEFGYQHSEGSGICDINETQIINTANSSGIGWLAWSWKGNGGDVTFLDLSSDWAGNSLSAWGNTVVNGSGGTKTAVTATVFNTTTNPTPTVTLTSPADNSTSCAGTAINIAATTAIASGTVSKVDFYDGNTLLGSDNSSPYSYTWNNPSAGTHTVRAIATSALNVASTAATITVNVGGASTLTPSLQINGGAWQSVNTASVDVGAKVVLSPQPTTGGTWSWTGCGTSGTSREQTLTPTAACTATATYTNTCAQKSTLSFNITIKGVTCCGKSTTSGNVYCCTNSDPDGDGWGWENNASCVVPGSAADADKCGVVTSISDSRYVSEIYLYPSPCKETLQLELPDHNNEEYVLNILNTKGTQVLSAKYSNAREQSINVSTLAPGLYLLKLSSQGTLYIGKFTKE